MRVLGISGSLRADSLNGRLLRHALGVLRDLGAEVEEFPLRDIPIYDQDLEAQGYPPAVERLRRAVAESQGLLIASPEYNNSVPGVLKNAIDWASRPPNPFEGKVALVMGATTGQYGTARMHHHLTYILESLGVWVVPRPRVLLARAGDLFDARGAIRDPRVADLVRGAMEALLGAMRRLAGP